MPKLKWDCGDSVERKRKFTVAVVVDGGSTERLVDIFLSDEEVDELEKLSIDVGVKFESLLKIVAISETR